MHSGWKRKIRQLNIYGQTLLIIWLFVSHIERKIRD